MGNSSSPVLVPLSRRVRCGSGRSVRPRSWARRVGASPPGRRFRRGVMPPPACWVEMGEGGLESYATTARVFRCSSNPMRIWHLTFLPNAVPPQPSPQRFTSTRTRSSSSTPRSTSLPNTAARRAQIRSQTQEGPRRGTPSQRGVKAFLHVPRPRPRTERRCNGSGRAGEEVQFTSHSHLDVRARESPRGRAVEYPPGGRVRDVHA